MAGVRPSAVSNVTVCVAGFVLSQPATSVRSRVTGVAGSYGFPSSVQPANLHPSRTGSVTRPMASPSGTMSRGMVVPPAVSKRTVCVMRVHEAVSVRSLVAGRAKS